jgi:hypothetical protein
MSINISAPAVQPARLRLPNIIGLGGACAGLAGGLAMALVEVLIASSTGQDIWRESKQIAAVGYGARAVAQPGFAAGPVVVGSLIHLVLSAVLGAIFAIVTRRVLRLTSDFGTPLLMGLIYGLIVWMAAYFVVLPTFDPLLLDSYAPAFIVQHLVYGLVTGLFYTWLRPYPYETGG